MSKKVFLSLSLDLLEPKKGVPSISIVAFGPPAESPSQKGRCRISSRCVSFEELAGECEHLRDELHLIEQLGAQCLRHHKKFGKFPNGKKRKNDEPHDARSR